MKKDIIILLIILLSGSVLQGQTAKNFKVPDCKGVEHELYANLDSGKVVVLCWVMPCGTCISPAKGANNAVLTYSATHPGKVIYYVADDYGNTTCKTVNDWLVQYAIKPDVVFSSTVINMYDYGEPGMPKTVVIGGVDRKVYFNENNTLNVTQLKNAINTALAASSGITGINAEAAVTANVMVYPSITDGGRITVAYQGAAGEKIRFDILSSPGALVLSLEEETRTGGMQEQHILLPAELAEGMYYLSISSPSGKQVKKFVLSR